MLTFQAKIRGLSPFIAGGSIGRMKGVNRLIDENASGLPPCLLQLQYRMYKANNQSLFGR